MNGLLSLAQMARCLGVTQAWLRQQADDGQIPCLKAGNRYLFSDVAVKDALAEQAAKSRQGAGNGQ